MRAREALSAVLLFLLYCGIAAGDATAAWSTDPTVNNAISTAAGDQQYPTIVSDGSGGAIITWADNRSGVSHIYAQRINANGVVQWTPDGVAICTAANGQYSPTIVSDGSGGAIITWQDYRSGGSTDVYAQRINANGVVQWTPNGVAISTAGNSQDNPTIVSDGSGGAIITWQDNRSGPGTDVYAQRINANGVVQWTPNGVGISIVAGSNQTNPKIVSDGSGGAIITWEDNRSGNYDVYARRIDASGVPQWTPNGVAICTAANDQQQLDIVSDGGGGAIITWHDNRSGTNWDIYARRIDASGAVQWTADGVAISTAAFDQLAPTIASDGSGGAIITWSDGRSGTNDDIYAQRINASGVVQWTLDGMAISTAANYQQFPTIVRDGSGGAIITWQDYRSGTNLDIYAQRINAGGILQWLPADGVAISTALDNQANPIIVSDASGGAIIAWEDSRNSGTTGVDIYAQRVDASGALSDPPSPSAVPTMNEWGMIIFVLLAGLGAVYYLRRQRKADR